MFLLFFLSGGLNLCENGVSNDILFFKVASISLNIKMIGSSVLINTRNSIVNEWHLVIAVSGGYMKKQLGVSFNASGSA